MLIIAMNQPYLFKQMSMFASGNTVHIYDVFYLSEFEWWQD